MLNPHYPTQDVYQVEELFAFIRERQIIYTRRNEGKLKPWTDDPILRSYRFCNVYRELDKETLWITKNWRTPYRRDPDLWFAMVVARLVNWHETLEELSYPIPWKPAHFVRVLHHRSRAGAKVFSGAYIVGTNGRSMDKVEYLAERVLTPLWKVRTNLRPVKGDTLQAYHRRLSQHEGMGSFMAAQVIADTKYMQPLLGANDWWTWAASGPGSRRGLNRVMSRPTGTPWREQAWLDCLQELHAEINPRIAAAKMDQLHAQDLQNCLCEFDKYERTRLGEGRPRSTYNGAP